MPKTRNYVGQMIYLEPAKARLLAALAKEIRLPRSVLLREGVDLVLAKYQPPVVSVPP